MKLKLNETNYFWQNKFDTKTMVKVYLEADD